MKIYAFVEGVSEAGAPGERRGAVGVLLRRLLGEDVDVTFKLVANLRIDKGPGGVWRKLATRALIEAELEKFDAVIFLVDLDGSHKSDVRTQLDEAQGDLRRTIRRAFGVAVFEFEAWLLADEVAIRRGVEDFDTTIMNVQPQPAPEKTEDAKAALEAIVGNRPKRELYPHIVRHLRLDHVATRCPRGFGEFRQRVLNLRSTET